MVPFPNYFCKNPRADTDLELHATEAGYLCQTFLSGHLLQVSQTADCHHVTNFHKFAAAPHLPLCFSDSHSLPSLRHKNINTWGIHTHLYI